VSAVIAAVLVALLPFVDSNIVFYGAVNTKFFFIIGMINVLLLWGVWNIFKEDIKITWKQAWFLYALTATLFVFYVAAFLGAYPELSLWSDILRSTGLLFLTHIALFAMILGYAFTKHDWSILRRAILISGAVFALLTIAGKNGFGFSGDFLWINLSEQGLSLGNSTFAGVYLLLAFVLGLVELARSYGDRKWRWVSLMALLFIALSPILFNISILFGRTGVGEILANPVLLLGSARASSATMLLLLVFLAGRYLINRFLPERLRWRAFLVWSAGILIGVTASIGLLFTPGSVVQNAYIESSTEARIFIWNSGFEAFQERPLLGWGPEDFSDAHERHFDNRLYLDENIGEIWFDRAHNILVDTLVTTGVVGMLALLLLLGVFLSVIYRSRKQGLVGDTEAVLLYALVPAHIMQLQTGFDTVASYVLLGVIAGYAIWLERRMAEKWKPKLPSHLAQKAVAVLLAVLVLMSLKFVLFDEYERQRALMQTFTARSLDVQKALVERSLTRTSDFEGLRLSGASFVEGALAQLAEPENQVSAEKLLSVADIYEAHYQKYMEAHPGYYRVRMNYAYLLLFETVLGRDRVLEAQEIIRGSYDLSPDNPLTYALDALALLYSGDLQGAKEKMMAGVALNPEIEFSREVLAHINEQEERFPNIAVLKLKNL